MPRQLVQFFGVRRQSRRFQSNSFAAALRKSLALLLVAACVTSTARDPENAIRTATQRYAKLVEAMDEAGIAAMFAPEGDLEVPGRQPIRGPAEIRHYLEGFRNFHVLSEAMTTDAVSVQGSTAHSSGTYRQQVRLPEGNTVEVHGKYALDWVMRSDGAWQITRMGTTPER